MKVSEWVDRGGSMGSAVPEHFEDIQDAGEPWPTLQSPNLPCGAEDHYFICTLPKKHSGLHQAHGADRGKALHQWQHPLDPINHPPHYTFGKIEVIDVIEDWGLSFHLAQVVKYVARAKHKGKELEDLRKAKWFLDRLITSLEK